MVAVSIPFPSSSSPGVDGYDGGGRLINAMPYKLTGAVDGAVAWRRAPGLKLAFETPSFKFRGALQVGAGLYLVQSNACYYVTQTPLGYSFSFIGVIPGDKPVTLDRNMKSPVPDVVCVHEFGVSVLTPTTVTVFNSPSLPQPNSVCYLDSYILYTIKDGRFFVTTNNGTEVNGLDFATAESNADGLTRGIRRGDYVILFGEHSRETWTNQANPVGMPLGKLTAKRGGLIGPNAITGFEDGLPDGVPIFYIGTSGEVYQLPGFEALTVSSLDVQRAIAAQTDKSAITMSSYLCEGVAHVVSQLSNQTWVIDPRHGATHERLSYGFNKWRANGSFYAFGKWFAGDLETGRIYEIDPKTYDEAGQPLVWEVQSGPCKAFPSRLAVISVDFDFATGVGYLPWSTDDQRNPKVAISWSDDGGKTWSNPIWRELGQSGQFRSRVNINRCGLTGVQGRKWKLVVSDPVNVVFLGGSMNIEKRAA